MYNQPSCITDLSLLSKNSETFFVAYLELQINVCESWVTSTAHPDTNTSVLFLGSPLYFQGLQITYC